MHITASVALDYVAIIYIIHGGCMPWEGSKLLVWQLTRSLRIWLIEHEHSQQQHIYANVKNNKQSIVEKFILQLD